MNFPTFANKLKKVIGGDSNTSEFTKTLFEAMISDPELIKNKKKDTYKAYFNGKTSISRVSSLVLSNLNNSSEFKSYIKSFGKQSIQMLTDEFSEDIEEINAANASTKIYDLFLDILKEASANKKSTQTSANNSMEKAIELPEKQETSEQSYSSEDMLLLEEFNSDYDEIMLNLIGENYLPSLLDMTLPRKIQKLYETKWNSKADSFIDSELKSYIFGLLGELNKLCNSFIYGNTASPFIKKTRTKIRNLYVKLHPDKFNISFPFSAFIDDWNDGEY